VVRVRHSSLRAFLATIHPASRWSFPLSMAFVPATFSSRSRGRSPYCSFEPLDGLLGCHVQLGCRASQALELLPMVHIHGMNIISLFSFVNFTSLARMQSGQVTLRTRCFDQDSCKFVANATVGTCDHCWRHAVKSMAVSSCERDHHSM